MNGARISFVGLGHTPIKKSHPGEAKNMINNIISKVKRIINETFQVCDLFLLNEMNLLIINTKISTGRNVKYGYEIRTSIIPKADPGNSKLTNLLEKYSRNPTIMESKIK